MGKPFWLKHELCTPQLPPLRCAMGSAGCTCLAGGAEPCLVQDILALGSGTGEASFCCQTSGVAVSVCLTPRASAERTTLKTPNYLEPKCPRTNGREDFSSEVAGCPTPVR